MAGKRKSALPLTDCPGHGRRNARLGWSNQNQNLTPSPKGAGTLAGADAPTLTP